MKLDNEINVLIKLLMLALTSIHLCASEKASSLLTVDC